MISKFLLVVICINHHDFYQHQFILTVRNEIDANKNKALHLT